MAKGKRTGKAHSSGYARYASSGTEKANRIKKLARALDRNPENAQIELALKNVSHRRHKPKTPQWSHSSIRIAKTIKQFTGKFDKNVLSADPVVFAAAIRARNENKFKQLKIEKPKGSMFSLQERAATWK